MESALKALLWFSTPADMYDPDYWEGGDWRDYPVSLAMLEDFPLTPSAESSLYPPSDAFLIYSPAFMTREAYLVMAVEIIDTRITHGIVDDPVLSLCHPSRRNHLKESILERIEEYCAEVESKYASSDDWNQTTEKPEMEKHLTWTVRYLVEQGTFSRIARDVGVQPSTVMRAVTKCLDLIGLQKRSETKPGRTKGSRSSNEAKNRSSILSELGR